MPAGLPLVANSYGKRQVWITGDRGPGRIRQVWRDNRIEIVGGECIIDSRARRISCVCSRSYVIGIVGITDESVPTVRIPPDRSKPVPARNARC